MENKVMETKNHISSPMIESLQWRSAVKKFDPSKKVSEADLQTLIQAANLAPSSGGLQPFRLLVINNPELRAQLHTVSFGQAQVVDASHFFVIAVQTDIDQGLVDNYINRVAEVRQQELSELAGLNQALSHFINSFPDEFKPGWATRQAFISLGTMISVAASMRIDACPMEGFEPEKYNEILDLGSKNLAAVALFAVGYRAEDDPFANAPKVRKRESDFVLRYD